MEMDSALWTGRETREPLQWASWTVDPTKCLTCSGSGLGPVKKAIQERDGSTLYTVYEACKQCDGTGERT